MLDLLRLLLAALDGPLAPVMPLITVWLVLVLLGQVLIDAYAEPGRNPRAARWSRALGRASVPLLLVFGLVMALRLVQLARLV